MDDVILAVENDPASPSLSSALG